MHKHDDATLKIKALTLIKMTYKRPCQRRGEGLQELSLSIVALDPTFAQKSFLPQRWHNFQLISAIFGFFSPWITKKM